MSVTVYNPTTGRYVTTLSTSAGAKKQASTAAIKSKDGGQVAPLVPTASSVKVSLSSEGRTALVSTLKLKLSELKAKLADPKFSPADLPGITLYVDDLKEITDLNTQGEPGKTTYAKILSLLTSQSGGKLMEVRANSDGPVKLDPATYQAIQDDLKNPSARILLDVTSNFSLDLPTGSDGKVASDITPTVLTSFKRMIETNRATKVTIDGQVSPVTLTPDVVTTLGSKTLARYPGKIVIDANSASLLTPENWENMRVLNNYHALAINLNQGVPASATQIESLSQSMSKLTYQQFIGGFNLLGSINTPAAPVALEPSADNASTKSQKFLFSGQFLNGDMLQLAIAPSGQMKSGISIGPLVLPNGSSPNQQADALLNAVKSALAKNADYSDLSVTRTGNALEFTWSGAGPDPDEASPIAFNGATHLQDSPTSFGVELIDVPPATVESLTVYPQVYGLKVKGTADQLIMNSDKLNKLITSGFVKSVQLTEAGTVNVTAAQAVRSIPLLEKIGANKVTISDAPNAPASYAKFSSAAANNLVGGIRILGSSTEILKSISGLAALTRMGKISTLTMTGNNGRQTVINNFDINKLSELVVSLRKGI